MDLRTTIIKTLLGEEVIMEEQNYKLVRTKKIVHKHDDDDDTIETHHDIHLYGKKVGELQHHGYKSYGNLHGKQLPSLSGTDPKESFHGFIKSKTGQTFISKHKK